MVNWFARGTQNGPQWLWSVSLPDNSHSGAVIYGGALPVATALNNSSYPQLLLRCTDLEHIYERRNALKNAFDRRFQK